jgi:formate-dependent nitrite reductase membrane component NrfD
MSKNFPVLSVLSVLIRLFGVLLVLVGIYYGIYEGIIEPNLPNHFFSQQDAMQLGGGMLALFFGIISLIVGESIGVLLAIEANTRHATESK